MKELKEIFMKIEKDKEDLKLNIQNIFTKIRNAINKREDELLAEVDNFYNKKYFNENIIKEGEKLPKQIKLSLDKGKLMNEKWENNNFISYINDCINIENNIKYINIINENIIKYNKDKKNKIEFIPKEDCLNDFLENLRSFGKICLNLFRFKDCPEKISNNRLYALSGLNKNIITKTGKDGRMGTICDTELDKSIEEHRWKIKILKSKDNDIYVGVAPDDFDIHSSTQTTCGWYLYCSNSSLYSGPPFKYSGVKKNISKVKDEIIVIMNMKKRTLKFIINNEDKGDSYTDIPIDKSIYPAVLMYYTNDSVEISECV